MPRNLPPKRADRPSFLSTASYWREGRRHLARALKLAGIERKDFKHFEKDEILAILLHSLESGGPYGKQTRRRYMQELKRLLTVIARGKKINSYWVASTLERLEIVLVENPNKKREKAQLASHDEMKAIFQGLRTRYNKTRRLNLALAAFMMLVIEKTAMRPVEILTAKVESNVLIIQNAKRKATEPATRELKMDAFPAKFIETLPAMLALFPTSSQFDFERTRNRLAETIARACQTNGIPRLSLYSFRGLRISMWIESGALDEVTAVLAGHASTLTAKRSYYQPVSSSWGPEHRHLPELVLASPDIQNPEKVAPRNPGPFKIENSEPTEFENRESFELENENLEHEEEPTDSYRPKFR